MRGDICGWCLLQGPWHPQDECERAQAALAYWMAQDGQWLDRLAEASVRTFERDKGMPDTGPLLQ